MPFVSRLFFIDEQAAFLYLTLQCHCLRRYYSFFIPYCTFLVSDNFLAICGWAYQKLRRSCMSIEPIVIANFLAP